MKKSFREMINDLTEATVLSGADTDTKTVKELINLNKARVGKTVISSEGQEVPNSVVLTDRSFAYKNGDKISIEVYNSISGKSSLVMLDKKQVKLLSSF